MGGVLFVELIKHFPHYSLYTYTYTHLYTYKHTYTPTHPYTQTHTHTPTHTSLHTHPYTHTPTHTVDVNADALAPALDRFAQFFINPTISEDGVDREANAVDSEYGIGGECGCGSVGVWVWRCGGLCGGVCMDCLVVCVWIVLIGGECKTNPAPLLAQHPTSSQHPASSHPPYLLNTGTARISTVIHGRCCSCGRPIATLPTPLASLALATWIPSFIHPKHRALMYIQRYVGACVGVVLWDGVCSVHVSVASRVCALY